MKNPFQKAEEQFGEIYGCRSEEVRRLFDSALEAEEVFDIDELERFAKERRDESSNDS